MDVDHVIHKCTVEPCHSGPVKKIQYHVRFWATVCALVSALFFSCRLVAFVTEDLWCVFRQTERLVSFWTICNWRVPFWPVLSELVPFWPVASESVLYRIVGFFLDQIHHTSFKSTQFSSCQLATKSLVPFLFFSEGEKVICDLDFWHLQSKFLIGLNVLWFEGWELFIILCEPVLSEILCEYWVYWWLFCHFCHLIWWN